ncbi:major facilitator superfamily [Pyrenochaeta sp. MPI-SDFR-AT-0127]|nr:major facilitator superfamily [Pyrenochaeta sp. MPI-SDFR-AT-0127]
MGVPEPNIPSQVGVFSWSWDAFDFHTATITYSELSKEFSRTYTQISVGITLTLMFRPFGAAIFGLAADRHGRQWPFIINNILLIIFELATGFCQTYEQFLAVRSLFGFAMGGIYGNAAATALEDIPDPAKGLFSGMYQNGYPFGYLLAVVFWKAFDEKSRYGWRVLFWFGAVPPVLLIVARCYMQETRVYQSRKGPGEISKTFKEVLEEIFFIVKGYWRRISYMILMMAVFSFTTHGTQDIYPLMLQNKYGFDSSGVTRVQVTGNIGGIVGGTLIGYSSQIFGRRLAIIAMCILGGALLYPYTFSSDSGLYAAAFFEQFMVQGAFGVVPIHLIELSPPAFQTFIVGTSYHLGILVASASNSIETAIGERYPLPSRDGTATYDYGTVICIFAACVFVVLALVVSLGPEDRGAALSGNNDNEESGRANPVDLNSPIA